MSSNISTREFLLRIFWYGGSTYDAWLNLTSAKIASRLLSVPQTYSRMGLPSAIVFQLLQAAIGLWTQFIINDLYLKYKHKTRTLVFQAEDRRENRHTVQLFDVLGGLLGFRWKLVSLVLNIVTLFAISFLQLVACSNIIYFLNHRLDKMIWTLLFGGIFSLSIFIPSAHNYHVWSFIGMITTVFASCYLAITPLAHGKATSVMHTGPQSNKDFFNGVSSSIVYGHVMVPVEIMEAMWRPHEYKQAFVYAQLYLVIVTMVPGMIIYINYGDRSLTTSNALQLLPESRFRDAALVLMLVHQFIVFGIFSLAIYVMWEKLLGVHDSKSYAKRTLARVPMFLALWLAALAFPAFGTRYRVFDASLVTWTFYILPCAAYNVLFWSEDERKHSRPLSRLGWVVDFCVNLAIALWVLIVECGLGISGTIYAWIDAGGFKLFPKCYGC